MSADLELLNMAAKAMGYWNKRFNCPATIPHGWSPMTELGHAMHMAAKLRTDICWSTDGTFVSVFCPPLCDFIEERISDHLSVDLATCYAIVRVAAEIGKAMP